MNTPCWQCGESYDISLPQCTHCCASNATLNQDSEQYIEHDWKVQDESFDHEFGTHVDVFEQCENCGKVQPHVPYDSESDFGDLGS